MVYCTVAIHTSLALRTWTKAAGVAYVGEISERLRVNVVALEVGGQYSMSNYLFGVAYLDRLGWCCVCRRFWDSHRRCIRCFDNGWWIIDG